MSVVLKPNAPLAKNLAVSDLKVSDFESTRREHLRKQINFSMTQVTNVLETKFDIR